MRVHSLWPPHIHASSKWDGKEIAKILVLRGTHHEYPFLVSDAQGNKAWVHSLYFS